MSDSAKEKEMKTSMQSLTESYLKGKEKEDPSITEADKQAFREFMGELTDPVLRQNEKK